MLLLPDEGHADRMEIKWKNLNKSLCVFCSCCCAQESPDFSLRYLVACVRSTVSPNKQRRGIWQGRHSSGSLEGGEKVFICGDSFKGPSNRDEE